MHIYCVSSIYSHTRADLQHHLFKLTLDGKLFLCPEAAKAQHVLDIGTGTGIWAMEYG
jgi:ubiquinone/menaquinone biosynthesis C-methylase UbiE